MLILQMTIVDVKTEGTLLSNPTHFRQVGVSLVYLTITRTICPIHNISQFAVVPANAHWPAVLHILLSS